MIRKCLVCGKKMKITVGRNGKADVGKYFGEVELPTGKGEWKRVGTKAFCGKRYGIVKWTGKKKKIEYWECDSCFKEVK